MLYSTPTARFRMSDLWHGTDWARTAGSVLMKPICYLWCMTHDSDYCLLSIPINTSSWRTGTTHVAT